MSRIRLHLHEIAGKHRLTQLAIAQASGLRTATVNALYHESAKGVQFDTLAQLLDGLHSLTGHRYTVADLIEHVAT